MNRLGPARVPGNLPALATIAVAFALVLCLAPAPASAEAPDVRVVSDDSGRRLQVNGEDFLVFGMNWGYIPIGENYSFNLWNEPEDVIIAALENEMSLLADMGVNAIRVYVGIPPRWVNYIYERWGIYTVINHTCARYGFTLDGAWIPSVDYSDPRLREAVKAEVLGYVDMYADTEGILMWLLGNENNYGLSWASFEIEALPEGEQHAARARYLYSLFGEITEAIQARDSRPVSMANGDIQYLELIAEECSTLDIFGTNVYRGISVRDLYERVEEEMGIPVMFTEFGADAFNARELREDQVSQARYLLGQWQEIYEQSAGKGRVGNAIGGLIFQWTDGWWKYGQDSRLSIHDTHASWPNGGYPDYVEGENNMNEEWWGIAAKGPRDDRNLFPVYPRAAYYALRRAFLLDPYASSTDLGAIARHFDTIDPVSAALEARGDTSARLAETANRLRLSGLRMEFETFSTGGVRTSTPEVEVVGANQFPAFQGFDRTESVYATFEARPRESVTANFTVNVLGNVASNPIDEIFYENRGRKRTLQTPIGVVEEVDTERIKLYNASVSWEDRWFLLEGFYRTGHLHWGYEGDFFGLYRDAYYGENIDIYNGEAPIGIQVQGKKALRHWTVAAGPELWWGANPSVFLKYRRDIGRFDVTAIYSEDIDEQSAVTSSSAIPEQENRKATIQVATTYGNWALEAGGIWSGNTKVDNTFQIAEEDGAGGYRILQDSVRDSDTFGAKVKLTYQKGRWNWYGQFAQMGLVADAGPTPTITFTNWRLKDSGSGNQVNVLSGLAVNLGDFQVSPNFLWQTPIEDPIPADVPEPGRPRNIIDDPFAVRANREMTAGELIISYDPTPETWMWAWDNDIREDAKLAASVGVVVRDMKTTQDAAIGILGDGRTTFAFPGAPPARNLWEAHSRIVSRVSSATRIAGSFFIGEAEPNGDDARLIERFGANCKLVTGPMAFEADAKFDDWGPYDYHRDFNLTFPVQLMGDISRTLGQARWRWLDVDQTRLGIRGTWRSLDEFSPRYCPAEVSGPDGSQVCDPFAPGDNGSEWEIRTYLHVVL